MVNPTPKPLQGQQGFTLIELLAVVTIIAILSISLLYMARDYFAGVRNAGIASNAAQLHQAVNAYVTSNQATIATQAMPYTITLAMLQSPAQYLNPSYNTTNNAGQVPVVRVIKDADGSLEVMIAYTGGSMISDGDLADIVANMVQQKAAGGYIHTGNGSVATGYQGSWTRDLNAFGINPGSGHVVDFVTYAASATADDSLHRHAVPGAPQYNTMSTTLNMGGNSITNANNISGNTLTLQGGNAIDIAGSYIYGDGSSLAMRSYTGNVYFQSMSGVTGSIPQIHNINGDSTSTFTASNISASNTLYAGVKIQSAGVISAAGQVTAGSDVTAGGAVYAGNWLRTYGATGWYSQTYGGGFYMSDPTWIRAYGDKNIYTGGTIQAGTIHSTGNLVADNVLQVNGREPIGGGCGGNALAQANDGSGQFVQCKSGVWTTLGGGYTTFLTVQGGNVNGFNTSIAQCPAGYVAVSGVGMVTANGISTNPAFTDARYSNTAWYARSNDSRVWGVAIAYCGKS
jgi:prepilin-type N-terminal cleavage/methylation domain-containing protein